MNYGKKRKSNFRKKVEDIAENVVERQIAKNLENKQLTGQAIDLGPGGVTPGGGTAAMLNVCVQGTGGFNQRIGDRIKCKGVLIRVFARAADDNNSRQIRIILARFSTWNQSPTMNGSIIFTATGTPFTSAIKTGAQERPAPSLHVYHDRYYVLPARAVGTDPPSNVVGTTYDSHTFTIREKLNFITNYEGNTGTATDIENNALVLFVVPDQGGQVLCQFTYSIIIEDA